MNIVSRVKGILVNPRQEWAEIDAEPLNVASLLTTYVLPLALIGPVATYIGWSTMSGFAGLFRPSIGSLLLMYVLNVVSVFVCAWVINALAPTFGGTQSMPQAIKVAAYSFTAGWVAAIFNIIPSLSILAVIGGLYGLYLLYLGLPMLMKAPAEKATTYTIVVIVAFIVIFIVVGAIAGRGMYR